MGEEISRINFSKEDFKSFKFKIREESSLLKQWFTKKLFSEKLGIGGWELEGWVLDDQFKPKASNTELIERLKDPMVVPEISRFNLEFNTSPKSLFGRGIEELSNQLQASWSNAQKKDHQMNLKLMMIGILPTIKEKDLNISNITPTNRYFALNEQLMKMRKHKPIQLDILGDDYLKISHSDIMLEAAATSFQIHLQIDQENGPRYYNASKIASASLVAISANSPFLFEHSLWEESRIPLFEQSISLAEKDYAERVTFGIRFLEDSLMEYFEANKQRYLPILPLQYSDETQKLRHLNLHNGTIWRWTRVIIGTSKNSKPSLRLEQRVAAAGPTIDDSVANSVYFYGLVVFLALQKNNIEEDLSFYDARDNFYEAARFGLSSTQKWENDSSHFMSDLIKNKLLLMSNEGLKILGVSHDIISKYLGIIEGRVLNQQTGSYWQKEYKRRHKCSFQQLCQAYYHNQQSEKPVHSWSLNKVHRI